MQFTLSILVIANLALPILGYPKPQEGQIAEEEKESVQQSEGPKIPAHSDPSTGESQLALALSLSGAKPQAVSGSSYAGRRKRSAQEPVPQETEQQTEVKQEESEDEHAHLGGSQLALALSLSGAKPQPVSASSYGGRRKRSAQEPVQQETEEKANEGEVPAEDHSQVGGSQLALALSLSNAKPQAVSASSYGG